LLELRPFLPGDDEPLISWVRSPDELFLFAGPSLTWPLDSGQLDLIRLRPDAIAWTAVLAPAMTPVGHIELVPGNQLCTGLIARVIIDPARRRQGWGRALLTAALDAARERDLMIVELRVSRHNAPAIALYTELGFTPIDAPNDDPRIMRMRVDLTPA
jgi:ribosomal protein S18 acetylase RimI-like enzyme